jgi:hypothetical protein
MLALYNSIVVAPIEFARSTSGMILLPTPKNTHDPKAIRQHRYSNITTDISAAMFSDGQLMKKPHSPYWINL